ncbi:nucleoporin nup57 [Acrodontium crateriforme]|uniref:Nucleoporin nup57 n=1 Tax=Acrodontium crateriforme TaxID=150365 RepID=A0AAQ3RAA2_9PEZI|nr:nucleoporin nup57 [Acrodontium crateriforme]
MSLFGNTQTGGSSLFGNQSNNQQQQSQQQQQPSSTSLFGNLNANANNSNPSGSLFGNTQAANNQQQPQQQQQSASNNSFFGNSMAPNNNQATMNNTISIATQLQAGLGSSTNNTLSASVQHELARSRLQASGIDYRGRQNVVGQAKTLTTKWDPQSQDTLLQAYLYNAVNAAYAPFYHRNADEDERSWELALAERPQPSEDAEGQQISYVPVLVRGFAALGERVKYQVNAVNEMRQRLHEMNNSLSAVMAAHQQRISVRIESARRQHVALSQRCLRLAVQVQTLRNKGYQLDKPEEELRKLLLNLERQVFDPTFTGREEEVWARMVALRERSLWLEEEGKRLGQKLETQKTTAVPDEVLLKTKKILKDYEDQLVHLNRELQDVTKEFEGWIEAQKQMGQQGQSTRR